MTDAKLLKYVIHLQNDCYQAIGFLTRQALREYIERAQIIPATEGGDKDGRLHDHWFLDVPHPAIPTPIAIQ